MKNDDAIWLSGLLAGTGTIYATAQGVVCLVVKSTRNPDMVERFATLAGVNMVDCKINRKPGVRATVQGERLRGFLKQFWQYLDTAKRGEYAAAVRKARGETP